MLAGISTAIMDTRGRKTSGRSKNNERLSGVKWLISTKVTDILFVWEITIMKKIKYFSAHGETHSLCYTGWNELQVPLILVPAPLMQ